MITSALNDTLNQGIALLETLSDDEYTQPCQLAYGASIGEHYRHILEHFIAIYESHAEGFVNYDLRKRNPEIQTVRTTAISVTQNIIQSISSLSEEVYEESIVINGKLSHHSEDSMHLNTSVGREVAYSIAHAHHHYAIIGIICNFLNKELPAEFGVAPSTSKHNAESGNHALEAKA